MSGCRTGYGCCGPTQRRAPNLDQGHRGEREDSQRSWCLSRGLTEAQERAGAERPVDSAWEEQIQGLGGERPPCGEEEAGGWTVQRPGNRMGHGEGRKRANAEDHQLSSLAVLRVPGSL